jgi:hypothetical protein
MTIDLAAENVDLLNSVKRITQKLVRKEDIQRIPANLLAAFILCVEYPWYLYRKGFTSIQPY